MEFKKPENFEDILNLQKELDKNIRDNRERVLEDIKLSLIAELVELNEETTDIYFFFAQLINYKSRDGRFQIEYYCEEFEIFPGYYAGAYFTRLIYDLLDNKFRWFFCSLLTLSVKLGYTKEDILNCYWEKWQKNIQRIGKEWN